MILYFFKPRAVLVFPIDHLGQPKKIPGFLESVCKAGNKSNFRLECNFFYER